MMDKKTIISAFRVAVAAACAISALSYGDEDPASIQHRYMTPSMRVSTNAWMSVSGNVERIVSASTNGLATKSEVEAHVADTNNPHSVTAAQTGAVPLVEDDNGAKTAVTVGIRVGTVGVSSLANGLRVTASGIYSHAEGKSTTASGSYSHAEGKETKAEGYGSHAEGNHTTASGLLSHAAGYYSQTGASDIYAFAWNGDGTIVEPYVSHGEGTFNINPVGGVGGFYIGEQTLTAVISNAVAGKADTTNVYTKSEVDAKVENAVLPTNPTFSNAVLAVGLNIDTNSVAVLNEIASTFGGFPIEGTATTVGGLLAALAAAVAWLRRNKADKATTLAGYGITDAATKAELTALDAKVETANVKLEGVA